MDEIRLGSRTLQPRRQLLANGARVQLGKRALDIASVLAEAGGEIVTKDELIEAVWPGVIVEENALQVHVAALRKALGPEAERLRTIRGVGYQLEIDRGPGNGPEGQRLEPVPEAPGAGAGTGIAASGASSSALSRLRSGRVPLLIIAALALIVSAWMAFRPGIGPEPSDRVPVLVRTLAASGESDPTEATLASGITDELIVRLRRIPELQVGTARADGSAPSPAFERAYVLDGTIRSSGDELRVTARLSDGEGTILWSETFNRRMIDLFEVQELIASNIANALSVPLDVGANARAHGGTTNPEAYAAYVLGNTHMLDFDQSVPQRYFEQAVQLDPNFVKASATLAATYGNRIPLASTKSEADRLLSEMDAYSAKALEANPNFWIGQAVRGWYDITRKDVPSAEARMRRAAELDRAIDPRLRDALAQYAVTLGRNREALAIAESQALIDPIYANSASKVFFLMMAGRYRDSVEMYERLARDEQQSLQGQLFHVYWARVLLGDEAGALEFVQGLGLPMLVSVAEQLPAFDQRGAWLESTASDLRRWTDERFGYGGQFQVANLALIAGHKGYNRLAVDLLRVAFERPGGYGLFYLWHPAMAEARKTDEFERLVTDLGFVKAWRESGDWGDFCQPVSATEIACR